jgi:hypothetical protein
VALRERVVRLEAVIEVLLRGRVGGTRQSRRPPAITDERG